jgi:hypothetical protein
LCGFVRVCAGGALPIRCREFVEGRAAGAAEGEGGAWPLTKPAIPIHCGGALRPV